MILSRDGLALMRPPNGNRELKVNPLGVGQVIRGEGGGDSLQPIATVRRTWRSGKATK